MRRTQAFYTSDKCIPARTAPRRSAQIESSSSWRLITHGKDLCWIVTLNV